MVKQKKSKSSSRQEKVPQESQRAEAITVFWMMALLATVLAQVAALVARLIVVFVSAYPALVLLSGLLLLIACVTGLLCLALTPLVLRWRRVAPPALITRFALVASFLPLVTAAAFMFLQRQ